MLADDDVNSICQKVKNLTLNISSASANLSRRYPNVSSFMIIILDYVIFAKWQWMILMSFHLRLSNVFIRCILLVLVDYQQIQTFILIWEISA